MVLFYAKTASVKMQEISLFYPLLAQVIESFFLFPLWLNRKLVHLFFCFRKRDPRKDEVKLNKVPLVVRSPPCATNHRWYSGVQLLANL